ncbi:MAG TPA: hypothetical protein VLK82_07425 [Candidatus Tectomicrobia bacterium]|nr:hypothetical protein [Candidatus Tectomicrobia bacterium]
MVTPERHNGRNPQVTDAPRQPRQPRPPRTRRLSIALSEEEYHALDARAYDQHRSLQAHVRRLIDMDVRRAKKETP